MIKYDEFKRIFDASPANAGFYINFDGVVKEYIILKYSDCIQFSRCGLYDSTVELFTDFESLMDADQVDGINLRRDWGKIQQIYPEGYDGTFEMYCECNGIEYRGELKNH